MVDIVVETWAFIDKLFCMISLDLTFKMNESVDPTTPPPLQCSSYLVQLETSIIASLTDLLLSIKCFDFTDNKASILFVGPI